MPLMILHSMRLSPEEKMRIGQALSDILHDGGIPQREALIGFKRESPPSADEQDPIHAVPASGPPPLISPEFRTRARRTRAELLALEQQLMEALERHGTLSSLQARKVLGLTNCDWAPATLRRLFQDLEGRGLVEQQGLKRGTCYAWKGSTEPFHSDCQGAASLRD